MITPPSPPVGLTALIEKWRTKPDYELTERGEHGALVRRICADELEFAVREAAAPPCVCTIEDGLVQEWVSKARAVAKAKGYSVGREAAAPLDQTNDEALTRRDSQTMTEIPQPAPAIVDGYDATFWNESYKLLREAILTHLDEFVHDTDEAEEAILIKAIELAGKRLEAGSPALLDEKIVGADGSFDIRTLAAEYGWIYTGHVVDWLRARLEELKRYRAVDPPVLLLPSQKDEHDVLTRSARSMDLPSSVSTRPPTERL